MLLSAAIKRPSKQAARQQTKRQSAHPQPRRQTPAEQARELVTTSLRGLEGAATGTIVVPLAQASRRGLERGEQTEVQGSGSKPYVVKRHIDGVLSCSCPAWRNKGGPAASRSCKHTALIAAEDAPRQQARAPRQQAPALLSQAIRPQPSRQQAASRARGGDPLGGGVLLAEKWKPDVDPTGCHMSEKLDGVRAYWNGEGLYSRNGNRFAAPAWFTDMLPSDTSLDGELYVGPGKFNEAVSIVRTSVPDDARWRSIRYMVFDMPDSPLPFEGRMDALEDVIATACRGKRSCPIVKVAQTVCRGPEHLGQFHKRVTAQGIEGTMLRRPGSPYERRRSSTLLKVKDFHDAEARVVGTYAGEGKHRGRIGGYEAVDEQTGVRFRVGTGLSDRQRENPLPIGTRFTYRYQERTPSGAPRFPSFVAARDYE